MSCDEVRHLLGAYLDGEVIDLVRVQEIEAHVAECENCAHEMADLQTLSSAVREKVKYFDAPRHLEARIRARTGVKDHEEPVRRQSRGLIWFSMPALSGGLSAVMLFIALLLFRTRSSATFESDLVASHIRSLQANHLFDVRSSSRHTVKPWFQGKLNFSPNVPDLTKEGFPLLGGRLDYLDHRPAAALVYGRAKHLINVFVMQSAPATATRPENREGYSLNKWRTGDLDYCAVSDVNPADLAEFAKDFQVATTVSGIHTK